MKKIIISAIFLTISFFANSQSENNKTNFNLLGELGIPVGKSNNYFSVTLGLKLDYLWEVTPEFRAGLATGYLHYFGSDISTASTPVGLTTITRKYDDASFIPLLATANYQLDKFLFAVDTGYALALNKGTNGGFYYKPSVGYAITESIRLNLFYSGISNGRGSYSNIGLGVVIF